jgi:hypothetical protein
MAKRKNDLEAKNAEKQLAHTKSWLADQTKELMAQRSKDRDFHGLQREFLYLQTEMLADFEKSKDVSHPRDVGDIRETILRKFLTDSGYLPRRYGVSDRSIRVASPTGHLSNEIDIAIYDVAESISLMRRENTYEVLPAESVYGVIQVKSRLNKKEIQNGLKNLASFKGLDRSVGNPIGMFIGEPPHRRGFGILFAFDTDLEWMEIVKEIEQFSNSNPREQWANAIFILNKGHFVHGTNNFGSVFNKHIEKIDALQVYGTPDLNHQCLFIFQSILLELLQTTSVSPPNLNKYFSTPLVAGHLSYHFNLGAFAEMGRCELHGNFPRKISPESLGVIVSWCRNAGSTNASVAWSAIFPDGLSQSQKDRAGDVWIYNPENHPLKDILMVPKKMGDATFSVIGYDMVTTDGKEIWLPFYYTVKEKLISDCPKCQPKPARPKRQPTPKKPSG